MFAITGPRLDVGEVVYMNANSSYSLSEDMRPKKDSIRSVPFPASLIVCLFATTTDTVLELKESPSIT